MRWLALLFGLLLYHPAFSQTVLVPLDVSTVTTGGTAVTALSSGHRAAGGLIQNPAGALAPLCVSETGTASGTVSAGSTTCLAPGFTYKISAAPGAVSVISSDSGHAFSGYGIMTPLPSTTTMYIIGNGAATITPRSTATYTVQAWGAGQSGNDGTGAGGKGAGWAKLNSFSATNGTPINFSLGAPGLGVHNGVNNGGDTWFGSSSTVLAPGGGSSTTAIGNSTAAGGAGGVYSTTTIPGGGGAGNNAGPGRAGGSPTCVNSGAGGSGGGNGGGTDGQNCTTNSNLGPAGGNGFAGTGGAGGTASVPNGATGGAGAGGGAGYGDNTAIVGNGGNGGDDYDNGGGGGGGNGTDQVNSTVGSNGGTPGGGGTDCFSFGSVCVPGQGGWSVIKITYPSTDADRIYWIGSMPMPTIPASWTNGYTTTTAGSVTIFTKNAPTVSLLGYLMMLGVGQ